jgi:hypothetical protein
MAGEEMTNWFNGHATVSGIKPGDWLDFRQTPDAQPLLPNGARLREFIQAARDLGAYVAAAHPNAPSTSHWQFHDELANEDSRPHGYEVWTGPFQGDDEQSVRDWDAMLAKGWHIWANGGSDLHGVTNIFNIRLGTPTNVVRANRLAQPDIIAAAKAGRCFVMRRPDGVECYLTATLRDQRTFVGGSLFGARGEQAEVSALVRGGEGMRLLLISGGRVVSTTVLTSQEQTVTAKVAGPAYVRAEVRGVPHPPPKQSPLGAELDMECLTNPIWLVEGDPPPGGVHEDAPPGPVGPRRKVL